MEEPLPDWTLGVLMVVLFAPVVGAMLLGQWNTNRGGALWRALCDDEGFTLELDRDDEVRFRSRTGRETTARELAFVRTGSKGSHTVREWRIEVGGLSQLGERSTIAVGLEGLTGAIRNRDRITDVTIGDRAFDRLFKVGGSDADVVRGVFAHDDVRNAVRLVFDAMTVLRCTLEGDSLVVEFLPNHVLRRTARRRIELVRRLADALASASASLALKVEATAPRSSVSSSSGSSVGVRIL